jgi:hypothetical protein
MTQRRIAALLQCRYLGNHFLRIDLSEPKDDHFTCKAVLYTIPVASYLKALHAFTSILLHHPQDRQAAKVSLGHGGNETILSALCYTLFVITYKVNDHNSNGWYSCMEVQQMSLQQCSLELVSRQKQSWPLSDPAKRAEFPYPNS